MFDNKRYITYQHKKDDDKVLGTIEFDDFIAPPVLYKSELSINVKGRAYLLKAESETIGKQWLDVLIQAYTRHTESHHMKETKTTLTSSTTSAGGKVIEIGATLADGREKSVPIRVVSDKNKSGFFTIPCYSSTSVLDFKRLVQKQWLKRYKSNIGEFNVLVRYKQLAGAYKILNAFTKEELKNKALQVTIEIQVYKTFDENKHIKRPRRKKKIDSDDDSSDNSNDDVQDVIKKTVDQLNEDKRNKTKQTIQQIIANAKTDIIKANTMEPNSKRSTTNINIKRDSLRTKFSKPISNSKEQQEDDDLVDDLNDDIPPALPSVPLPESTESMKM